MLGQLLSTDTERNSGGEASAATLLYPSGVWSDGIKLIVADAWNHRVLIWNSFPKKKWSTGRCGGWSTRHEK
ncbi:MAG: hypothetical protein ABIT58_03960 [Ferruginibacter sp.]